MNTLKQILEACTPGPWKARKHGNQHRGEWRIDGKGWQNMASVFCGERNPKDATAEANAQLIARCNPATMAKVLKALDLARDCFRQCDISTEVIDDALSALNNPTP